MLRFPGPAESSARQRSGEAFPVARFKRQLPSAERQPLPLGTGVPVPTVSGEPAQEGTAAGELKRTGPCGRRWAVGGGRRQILWLHRYGQSPPRHTRPFRGQAKQRTQARRWDIGALRLATVASHGQAATRPHFKTLPRSRRRFSLSANPPERTWPPRAWPQRKSTGSARPHQVPAPESCYAVNPRFAAAASARVWFRRGISPLFFCLTCISSCRPDWRRICRYIPRRYWN